MADPDDDTSRTVVKTHVPKYQKRIWVDHAEALEMSQSEFLRTMVQAGRKGLESTGNDSPSTEPVRTRGGETADLDARVESILSGADPLSWDDLVAALTDDLEDRLEQVLQSLQEENRVRYSGRSGGYTLNERS